MSEIGAVMPDAAKAGKLYECWKHGTQHGDHCPLCVAHCYMPPMGAAISRLTAVEEPAKPTEPKVNKAISERVWVASYTASKYASVLCRDLHFRSIHDSKESAEKMPHDTYTGDFAVTEYAKVSATGDVREGVEPIYVAFLDEVPTLSTQPHEIAEEYTSKEIVSLWDGLKTRYLAALQQVAEKDKEIALLSAPHPFGPLYNAMKAAQSQADKAEAELSRLRGELAAMTTNRDQWERNSSAENKRAGTLEIEVRRLRGELKEREK